MLEPSVIEALYEASSAGVEIDLIVRGICSLRPGMPGVSERIRVRSIIGRYLEHSRIFCFANGGDEEIYCGSADWMPRNLFERCEVVFPVKDPSLVNRLRNEILAAQLADTVKTRLMRPDGSYGKLTAALEAGEMTPFSSQDFFMSLAEGRASIADIPNQPIPASLLDPVRPQGANHEPPLDTSAQKRVRRPRTVKAAVS
jgi:polyphosphate kinase